MYVIYISAGGVSCFSENAITLSYMYRRRHSDDGLMQSLHGKSHKRLSNRSKLCPFYNLRMFMRVEKKGRCRYSLHHADRGHEISQVLMIKRILAQKPTQSGTFVLDAGMIQEYVYK